MRKYLVAVLAVLMLAAFTTVSLAAEEAMKGAEKAKPAKAEKMAMEKAMGTVKSVDAAKGELVITTEAGADMAFKVTKRQAKNIKEGEMVTVSYEKKGEEMVAKRVMKAKMKKEKMEMNKEAAPKEEKK